jgi:hypothetical protein
MSAALATPDIREYVPAGNVVSAACPCCGTSEWEYLGDRLFLLISKPSSRVAVGDPSEGIEAVAFVCRSCRFIRLQAADV